MGFNSGWDTASPYLDAAGNTVWQVSTTAGFIDPENWNKLGAMNFVAGTCFDANGILSPFLADDDEPISWGVLVANLTVLNLIYGVMSCAAGVETFNQSTGVSVASAGL